MRKISRREAMVVIAAAAGCRGTMTTTTTVPDAATATPKVVKVKLENDRVRVLDYVSDPGDKEPWHFHPAFVVYVVTGGTLRITTPDGKSDDIVFTTGEFRLREPMTHATENVGKTQLHAVIVELKAC